MGEEKKIQWHAAFCSAVELELRRNRNSLSFDIEHTLNTKPLQIDLLVIKKPKDVQTENDLGKIFREHNILEYKSPGDKLDEDVVLKVFAYACLYKVQEEKLGEISIDEITLTIVRETKPIQLIKKLRVRGFQITKQYDGIYYVIKDGFFRCSWWLPEKWTRKIMNG